MKIHPDRIVALLLLTFCLAYGVLARSIELYPGAEKEVFNARTFPLILALMGSLLALLLLVLPPSGEGRLLGSGREWVRAGGLGLLGLLYALALRRVGFLASSTLFLAAGFWVLGERSWKRLVLVPLAITAGFQIILHGLLDIYLVDPLLQVLRIVR